MKKQVHVAAVGETKDFIKLEYVGNENVKVYLCRARLSVPLHLLTVKFHQELNEFSFLWVWKNVKLYIFFFDKGNMNVKLYILSCNLGNSAKHTFKIVKDIGEFIFCLYPSYLLLIVSMVVYFI